MDAMMLVNLLGHGSASDEFERAFETFGITQRPKSSDLTTWVKVPDKGLVFEFSAEVSFKREIGAPTSPGRFVLSEIQFSNASDTPGTSEIDPPFGIEFDLNPQRAESMFGKPKETEVFKGHTVQTFLLEGLLLTIRYKKLDDAIEWFKVSLPTIYDRERGLVP